MVNLVNYPCTGCINPRLSTPPSLKGERLGFRGLDLRVRDFRFIDLGSGDLGFRELGSKDLGFVDLGFRDLRY